MKYCQTNEEMPIALTNQNEAYLYQGKHEILSDMCEEMPIFLNQSKGRITLSRQA
jgi:hypothetical protein